MSYEKQTWQTGDIITAEKLNHMEEGITGGTLIIGGFSRDNERNIVGVADKTWQEIHDALVAGKECIVVLHDGNHVLRVVIDQVGFESGAGKYFIGGGMSAECDLSDEYPTA